MPALTESEIHTRVRYATRIPILRGRSEVIGYKLLFSSHIRDYRPTETTDGAARNAIDFASLIGLNALCDGHLAFLECDRETLVGGLLLLLPPDKVVAEIPAGLQPDEAVRKACNNLRNRGYELALGNFTVEDPREPLTELASYIKVNLETATLYDATDIARRYGRMCRMVAERVETREALEIAIGMGFEYFQGYFFRRPSAVTARSFPANQFVELQLVNEICREDLDWGRVEEMLKHDPSLYYRLLRYANSALLAVRGEVKSIRQVLLLLGEREFSRWCRLALTFDLSRDKPSDIILAAMVRGRFCELIGRRVSCGEADLFLLGMFTLIDAILDAPMRDVLEGLPLEPEAKTLLSRHEGALAPFFKLMFCIESGNWERAWPICYEMGISDEFAADCYREAIEWAHTATARV